MGLHSLTGRISNPEILPGLLFTKKIAFVPPNHVKSESREIGGYNERVDV